MRILAALVVAPLTLGSLPVFLSPPSLGEQDPAADAELPPLLRLKKEREKFLSEGVLGCWQLDGYTVSGVTTPAEEITGNALFCEGYLALLIHAIGFDEVNFEEVTVAQAGIFRYRVDEFGALQTSTVMGHSNPLGDLEYDAGGELREYTLDLDRVLLTFRHQDGTVLTFSRMEESAFSAWELTRLSRHDADGISSEEDPPTSGDLTPLLAFRRAQQEALEQGVKGSWQLLDYTQNGAVVPEDEITAHFLFCDGYSALVIHALGFDEATLEEVSLAQAGLFRYRVDESAELQTSTIIGHANPFGEVEWEDEGELREYALVLEKGQDSRSDLLTLTHEDGTTMRLGRTAPGQITQKEVERLNQLRGLGFDTDVEGGR